MDCSQLRGRSSEVRSALRHPLLGLVEEKDTKVLALFEVVEQTGIRNFAGYQTWEVKSQLVSGYQTWEVKSQLGYSAYVLRTRKIYVYIVHIHSKVISYALHLTSGCGVPKGARNEQPPGTNFSRCKPIMAPHHPGRSSTNGHCC